VGNDQVGNDQVVGMTYQPAAIPALTCVKQGRRVCRPAGQGAKESPAVGAAGLRYVFEPGGLRSDEL
jgi:hypothetical protein